LASTTPTTTMSNLDYHVLLALAKGPLYGYAIKEAIEAESGGTLLPRAGSMYRVLARLLTGGLVEEASAPGAGEPHPGLARRYYALTPHGRGALAAEARRLKRTARLAEERLRMQERRS
jgi:DNA-binding PadR family transcriptional regulator